MRYRVTVDYSKLGTGYVVVEAESPEEAIEAANQCSPLDVENDTDNGMGEVAAECDADVEALDDDEEGGE